MLQKVNSKLWTKKLKQIWYRHILRKSSLSKYQNIIEEDPDYNEAIDDNHANELLEEKLAVSPVLPSNSTPPLIKSNPVNSTNLNQHSTYWTLAMSENGNLFRLYYLNNSASNHVIIVPYL